MVTVIIPIYNTEKYLSQALDSVINQSYQNLQIICIDDGSTDKSLELLHEYEKNDKRIEIITHKNKGISYTRNEGIKSAKGKYIVFLDSDDWMDLNVIEVARNKIIEERAEIVFWGYYKEYQNRKIKTSFFEKDMVFDGEQQRKLTCRIIGPTGKFLKHPEYQDSFGTVWGKMYLTQTIKNNSILFKDLNLIGTAEDVLFNIEAFSCSSRTYFLSTIYHHYRKFNLNSYTSNPPQNLENKWERLFSNIHNIIKQYNHGQLAKEALNNRIALSLILLGINKLSNQNKILHKFEDVCNLMRNEQRHKAMQNLSIRYMPLKWKLFFTFAKMNIKTPVFIMLYIMHKILKARKS